MSKRMLADLLWEAANERLCPNGSWNDGKQAYSCWAIETAARTAKEIKAADQFVRSFGVNPVVSYFKDFPERERQGVRYMWLLLAMHVAEDEGIALSSSTRSHAEKEGE